MDSGIRLTAGDLRSLQESLVTVIDGTGFNIDEEIAGRGLGRRGNVTKFQDAIGRNANCFHKNLLHGINYISINISANIDKGLKCTCVRSSMTSYDLKPSSGTRLMRACAVRLAFPLGLSICCWL